MTTISKKLTAVLVSILLTLSCFSLVSLTPVDADAATKTYMEKLKLKWDLKNNKTVKSKVKISGLKSRTAKIRVSNYKSESFLNPEDNNIEYKKITFNLKMTINTKFTKKQLRKLFDSKEYKRTGNYGCWPYIVFVDCTTGKRIHFDRTSKNIKYTFKGKGYTFGKKYRDPKNRGSWFNTMNGFNGEFTLVLPAYENEIIFGAGVNNTIAYSMSDDDFDEPLISTKFGKTSRYLKGKSNSHWMHLR